MRRRSGFNIPMVEYLVNQWRHVLKVEVNAQLLTPQAFRTRLLSSPPPISLATWGPIYPDPDCFLGQLSSLDVSHSPQFERLIAEARAEMNHGQRMALYRMAHQLLLTEAAIVPLVYPAGQYLLKPWFRYEFGGRYWQDFVLLPH
jgi:ABC-type oligopeptide transport system substrate-binding subunit